METSPIGSYQNGVSKNYPAMKTIEDFVHLENQEVERMCVKYFNVLDTKVEGTNKNTIMKKLIMVNEQKVDRSAFGFDQAFDVYNASDPDLMFYLGFNYFQRHDFFHEFVQFYRTENN